MTRIPKLAVFSFPRSGREFVRKTALPKDYPTADSFLPTSPLFQSHDFLGGERCDDRPNIVLLRDPYECFASWFELDCRNGGRPYEFSAFRRAVLDEWVPYWKRFTRDHVLSGRAPVIPFGRMVSDPQWFFEVIHELTGTPVCNPRPERRTPQGSAGFPFYPLGLTQTLQAVLEPEYTEVIKILKP